MGWIFADFVVVNNMLQIGPVSVAHPHGAAWALNVDYTRLAQSHGTMFLTITDFRRFCAKVNLRIENQGGIRFIRKICSIRVPFCYLVF